MVAVQLKFNPAMVLMKSSSGSLTNISRAKSRAEFSLPSSEYLGLRHISIVTLQSYYHIQGRYDPSWHPGAKGSPALFCQAKVLKGVLKGAIRNVFTEQILTKFLYEFFFF